MSNNVLRKVYTLQDLLVLLDRVQPAPDPAVLEFLDRFQPAPEPPIVEPVVQPAQVPWLEESEPDSDDPEDPDYLGSSGELKNEDSDLEIDDDEVAALLADLTPDEANVVGRLRSCRSY